MFQYVNSPIQQLARINAPTVQTNQEQPMGGLSEIIEALKAGKETLTGDKETVDNEGAENFVETGDKEILAGAKTNQTSTDIWSILAQVLGIGGNNG